ncbi:MAG TPA: RNA polymerase sigma factor [Polyangiaceae bacterium]|jgi:RNA polymerase sigma-70 factor (ECF subfamily)|nr:RNA polymerase sigma factor [Polyangiaceae bacterium]
MIAFALPNERTKPPRVPETERAILLRCKGGDAMAFRAFVVRYERAVFALLSRMLGRGPHVEDLAQETFLRAHRAFGAFDVDAVARPSTWLLTIATRLALDWSKRRMPRVAPIDDAAEVAATSTPESDRARAELGRAIARAAQQLPADQRAAFVLAELHDFTNADIAVALGVPEATVKTRLFRAREKMRVQLEEWKRGGR